MMTIYYIIMRTIIELQVEQVAALAELCERTGISRAEAIRRAVDRFLKELGAEHAGQEDHAFGSWRGRVRDPLAYEDELRGPREDELRGPRDRVRRGTRGRRRESPRGRGHW